MKETNKLVVFHDYPIHTLSEEEAKNPWLVIDELFGYCHLPELREMLWDSFKANITGSYNKRLSGSERRDIVFLHEYLEKLLEAAHILNERQKSDQVKEDRNAGAVFYPFDPENILTPNINDLCQKYSSFSPSKLDFVLRLVIEFTNAERVYLLNISSGNGEPQFDFLALLPSTAPVKLQDYKKIVNEACSAEGDVLLWCGHSKEIHKELQNGNIFFTAACTSDNLVYDNKAMTLPDPVFVNNSVSTQRPAYLFNSLFNNAMVFLEGAEFYLSAKRLNASAFLLHQAAEHALRALLYSLTIYRSCTHHLATLLRHTNFLSADLATVFPCNSDHETAIFDLLSSAYVRTRYKEGYFISEGDLQLLISRVKDLHRKVKKCFDRQIKAFPLVG